MGIEYLLMLQNFREATNDMLSPFMIWISDFAVEFWPVAMAAMVFWVFDRNAGRRILSAFGLGTLMNGFLKLTFRITRPWLKDSRIIPYGNAKISATGYSFPSGHATYATALFGGMAWWQRKKNITFSIVMLLALLITMFSRNYLGVHTVLDVFAGFFATVLMMIVSYGINTWTNKDKSRDLIVMVVGLVLCGILVVYYRAIQIKEVYDAAGTLVVDPPKMKADSYEGIGFVSTFVVCRYFERKYFDFDTVLKRKYRFIIGLFALIPMYLWVYNIFDVCKSYSRALGRFATHSGTVVYILIVVPFMMSKIKFSKWLQQSNQ